MREFFKSRSFYIILSVLAIVLMWVAWVIAYAAVGNDYVMPSFTDSMVAMGETLASSTFWTAFGYTFLRTIFSFLISFVLAAICCALATASPQFKAFLRPIMGFLRALPTLAIVLLLLIWTSPTVAPVVVTCLVLFPSMYAQMTAAVGDVGDGVLQMAKAYGISRTDRIFKIYMPAVAPNVIGQSGANMSLGLKITVSAEVMCNTLRSIGGMMQNARLYLDMPRLAALTLITVLLGLVLEGLFALLRLPFSRWRNA